MDMRVSRRVNNHEDKSIEITPFEGSSKTKKKNNRVSVTRRTIFGRINIHKIKVPEGLRKNGTEKNIWSNNSGYFPNSMKNTDLYN